MAAKPNENTSDPRTSHDAKSEIMRYSAQSELASPLTKKFEDEGLANIQLAYELGQDCWAFTASRGTSRGCQTPERVNEVVGRFVRELGHEIDRGLIVALVLGDRIASRFRLQPRVQP